MANLVSIFSYSYSFLPFVGIFVLSLYEFYLLYITFAFVFNISKHLGSFDRTTIFNAMSFFLLGFSDEMQSQLSLRHSKRKIKKKKNLHMLSDLYPIYLQAGPKALFREFYSMSFNITIPNSILHTRVNAL